MKHLIVILCPLARGRGTRNPRRSEATPRAPGQELKRGKGRPGGAAARKRRARKRAKFSRPWRTTKQSELCERRAIARGGGRPPPRDAGSLVDAPYANRFAQEKQNSSLRGVSSSTKRQNRSFCGKGQGQSLVCGGAETKKEPPTVVKRPIPATANAGREKAASEQTEFPGVPRLGRRPTAKRW